MGLVDHVRGVALNTIGVGFARYVGGNAVQQEVADRIGREVEEVVTGEIGQLSIKAVRRPLQRQHAELSVLILVLVELRRIEIGDAECAGDRRIAQRPNRRARDVGNLERAGGGSGDQAQPRRRVDESRHVGEAFSLLGKVVDGVGRWQRILDAFGGLQIAAGEHVLHAGEAVGR